jgi:hypothetical protein
MFNTAPKFKKVELLLKLGGTKNYNQNDSLRDLDLERTTKITMEDCSLVITGEYLIVTKDDDNFDTEESKSTSKIYNLSEIDSYRIYNN